MLWNNGNITTNNKSLYMINWIDIVIICVVDLLDDNGNLCSYENFLKTKCFPVK